MIQSVDRAMQVLEILRKEKKSGVTEIGNKLGVNKSTAFRILSTLEDKGFVEKDDVTSKYKLGIRLIKFSNSVINDLDITKIAKPLLRELVEMTGESAHLCILSKSKAVFIDQVKSSEVINVSAKIGGEEPLYCSAVGKSMIAFLPEKQLNDLIDIQKFIAFTPRTITSRQVLLEQLEKIKEVGYAVDDEEINSGVRCIAAPIRNFKGKVVASVGISCPANRVPIESIGQYSEAVKKIATSISGKLGYF